ncbi:MAG: hypothetical protein MUE34_14120, partial [Acidimicrobiales bacterium]|nr:hypothetical protein [Acidimicrobiales bacterium]
MAWFAPRTVSVNSSAPSAAAMTALGEGVEVVAGGAAVDAAVALREVRHRCEEVAERVERHTADGAQVAARSHQSLLGRHVLRALLRRQRHPDERDARAGADAVGDRLLEAVPVTDAAEVRDQQLGDRIVGPLEGGGQAESLLVLGEHGAPQHAAAEAVALVGDEQAPAAVGRDRAIRSGRVAGGDEDVAGLRQVAAAVTEASDASARQRSGQPAVPLLEQDARRHQHQHEPASCESVSRSSDGQVRLAR